MLLAVFTGQFGTPINIALQGGIHDQLLANRVPGELPDKLVLVAGLLVRICRFHDAVIVSLQLAVIVLDSVDDTSSHYDRGALKRAFLDRQYQWTGCTESVKSESHKSLLEAALYNFTISSSV
jgi:hypothetical protein